jgi:hypothetical protein
VRREEALLPGPDIIAPTLYQMLLLLLLACKQMQHPQKKKYKTKKNPPRPRTCDCFSHLQVIQKSNVT